MIMEKLELNSLEQAILANSSNEKITLRRRTMILVSGGILAVLLLVSGFVYKSWGMLLFLAMGYVLITVFEKFAYANAVLGYKSLIQKLVNRIEELESNENLKLQNNVKT